MNYYLPFNSLPYQAQTTGLLSRIFRNGINWSAILSNTQRTLNIINQTIPVIKQVKPVVNNAKTMFKIMNEFKKAETPEKQTENIKEKTTENTTTKTESNTSLKNNNNGPTFFV